MNGRIFLNWLEAQVSNGVINIKPEDVRRHRPQSGERDTCTQRFVGTREIEFLAGPMAAFVSGQVFRVDGGGPIKSPSLGLFISYRVVAGLPGLTGAGDVAPDPVVDAGGVTRAGSLTVVPLWLDAMFVSLEVKRNTPPRIKATTIAPKTKGLRPTLVSFTGLASERRRSSLS